MCEQLRLEISKVHSERLEKVEKKVSVKLVNKDPSKRVRINTWECLLNWHLHRQETHKIQAISLFYEIHSLKKRHADMKLRSEEQTQVRSPYLLSLIIIILLQKTENKKKEVNRLRTEISRLKVMNSNITIGVPINKIDVRQRKFSDESASVSPNTMSSSTSLTNININNFGADFTFQEIAEMMAD